MKYTAKGQEGKQVTTVAGVPPACQTVVIGPLFLM